MLVEKYGWATRKNLFGWTNQDSTLSHIHGNSINVQHNFKIF